MIRINQLKLSVGHTKADMKKKAAKMMRIPEDKILSLVPVRQSLDARKKNELLYIYSLNATVSGKEGAVIKNAKNVNVVLNTEKPYRFPEHGQEPLCHRPVIVGFGPAGMFCGLMLARAGFSPLILERGEDVDSRTQKVEAFWRGGELNPESNVQFGEGGAGTFSDGKLNTLVKDPSGRNKKVLEILAEAGADPSITYINKPHVGTDVLSRVVKNIRQEIIRLGGEIRFGCKLTDFSEAGGRLISVTVSQREEGGFYCRREWSFVTDEGSRFLDKEALQRYKEYLIKEERAKATVDKYLHDVRVFEAFVRREQSCEAHARLSRPPPAIFTANITRKRQP